jgi:large subunit ribosomal protein L28
MPAAGQNQSARCAAEPPHIRLVPAPRYLKKESIVASHCDVCGKGPGFGMSVSHSHRRTHRRWNPNVQTVRALVAPGTRRRVTVCTSCLKAGKVTRA